MKKRVELSFILDETGSMGTIRENTIGSFNTFLEEQKALDADVTFSLALFSLTPHGKTYRSRYNSVSISEVKPLTTRTYQPSGTTPLLDAIGGTVDNLGKRIAKMLEVERPDQVIVVILTDGLENASREYTTEQIREKIEHQRDVYKWEFIFLGCGIDAFSVGGQIGAAAAFTSSHTRDAAGVRAAYAAASHTISSLVHTEDTTQQE